MEWQNGKSTGVWTVILVLGGTSESRDAAKLFVENGYQVIYTSTTGIISDIPAAAIHTVGELDETSFRELLKHHPINCIVDATHPFATAIKSLAVRTADTAGIPCIRLEREGDKPQYGDPSVIVVDSLQHAVESITFIPGGILSTVGTRMLSQLCEALGERRRDLVVRVLPLIASLTECEKCKFHASRIIAMHGPFDKAFNLWCIERFKITTMLTKESGERGGFKEKIEACREAGCTLVVIGRPNIDAEIVCRTPEQCLKIIESMSCD